MLPPPADLINWGWLRIGPPYIYININPVIFQIGPLTLRWYGLMYVVGILVGWRVVSGYIARKGISQEAFYRSLWWGIAAGLLGGRLYFVIQQHDLVQGYLEQPWRILATWEGGMAFYGAIFLVVPTIYWRSRVERINPLVFLDAAALLGAAGQIFGRIGNLINGDIIGYTSTLPWSTVYVNPYSWACNPYVQLPTCNTPVQPAAGYELLSNLVLLGIMLYLARRLTRPGLLILFYLYSYSIIQFLLFFVRDNTIETPFGLNWGLKQAQWTSLAVFIVLLPITYWIFRTSKPVPAGEVAATYGIPQFPGKKDLQESVIGKEVIAEKDKGTSYPERDPERDPIISSAVTEALLRPDKDIVTEPDSAEEDQEIQDAKEDTITESETTQEAQEVEEEMTPESEIAEAPRNGDVDTISESETVQVAPIPDADMPTGSETAEVAQSAEVDTTAEAEAVEAPYNGDVDTTTESETAEEAHEAEEDTTSESETSREAPESETAEKAQEAEESGATESEVVEAPHNGDVDTTAESETVDKAQEAEEREATESEVVEAPHNGDVDTTAEPETSEVASNLDRD